MEIRREEGLFTYHMLSDKERKNLSILTMIKKKGPVSRTDVSKATDINMVSVSNYVKDYIDAGIVLEKGFDASSGGRRPELVELNKEGIYVIGIEVSEKKARGALTNLEAIAVKRCEVSFAGAPDLHEKVTGLAEELIAAAKEKAGVVKAIGIGVQSPELISVRKKIEDKFGISTYAGSDAACAAFGEKSLNPEADVPDLLYMHSDTGCGIIVRGDIYFGSGGSAGEMQISDSHISKEEAAILLKDSSYLKPWNVYLGIIEFAKREMEKGVGTKIVAMVKGDKSKVTKEVVIEAAKDNDDVALSIVEMAAMNLGIRISYLINLFNPEVVVVGGGIEKAGDLMLGPIRDKINKFVFSRQASVVKIIPSALGEDAVSTGAASLAVREVFIRA